MIKIVGSISTLLLFLSTVYCESNKDEFELEKAVLTQILPSLVDSICVDSRMVEPSPMLGEFVTDKKGDVFLDSTKITEEQEIRYKKWETRREVAKKDTSEIILAFNPWIKNDFNPYFDKKLLEEFPISEFSVKGKDTLRQFLFDYSKIKLNNKFKLKNISEFSNTDNHPYLLFERNYNFVFSGIFTISRIQFDKEKTKGLFKASFSYCGRCGRGYNVYVKEINGVWEIDKIEDTWIS
ncbi:hypothetical protein [Flavobacterium sp. UMI-01]|uniref:hypothetical protein n=1 Tax=Flavobacterium sp. UMI-01 TaxID=1441053 RepID=UPI001C7CBA64|nr:hypothetical protein [Flavobacterium sp. UMI-01]GIZ09195.1 hypothetical protein FUMI01_19220 [Flavobacterium sp. UMI-01]